MNTPTTKTPTPEPSTGVGPNCAVSTGSVTYALFKHMADEHGLMLLESEMAEIVRIVNDNIEARLRWWVTNAEGIAKERGELFRVGERMQKMLVLAPDAPVDQPGNYGGVRSVGRRCAANPRHEGRALFAERTG